MAPWLDLVVPVSSVAAVVVPTAGYLVKRVINAHISPVQAQLDEHERIDSILFNGINEKLTDLKNEQRSQTEKLDRIVERML